MHSTTHRHCKIFWRNPHQTTGFGLTHPPLWRYGVATFLPVPRHAPFPLRPQSPNDNLLQTTKHRLLALLRLGNSTAAQAEAFRLVRQEPSRVSRGQNALPVFVHCAHAVALFETNNVTGALSVLHNTLLLSEYSKNGRPDTLFVLTLIVAMLLYIKVILNPFNWK